MALRQGIVNMYEAALGAFNVVESERVWHTAEFKAVWIVERSCVEYHNAIPTALHRYRLA